jgi:hypothetical protein
LAVAQASGCVWRGRSKQNQRIRAYSKRKEGAQRGEKEEEGARFTECWKSWSQLLARVMEGLSVELLNTLSAERTAATSLEGGSAILE